MKGFGKKKIGLAERSKGGARERAKGGASLRLKREVLKKEKGKREIGRERRVFRGKSWEKKGEGDKIDS